MGRGRAGNAVDGAWGPGPGERTRPERENKSPRASPFEGDRLDKAGQPGGPVSAVYSPAAAKRGAHEWELHGTAASGQPPRESDIYAYCWTTSFPALA